MWKKKIYLAMLGLICIIWNLSLQCTGCGVCRLSSPATCGISVPRPGIKPMSSALKGRFFNYSTTREVPSCCLFFFKSHLLRPLEALLYCLIALKIIDEKPVVSLNSAPLRWPIWSLWGIIGSTDYLWCSRSLQKSI